MARMEELPIRGQKLPAMARVGGEDETPVVAYYPVGSRFESG